MSLFKQFIYVSFVFSDIGLNRNASAIIIR